MPSIFVGDKIDHGCTHKSHQVAGVHLQLQTTLPGTHIDMREIGARGMKKCGKRLLHAHGRAPATNVTCSRQQFLHGNQVGLLVARHLGGFFQIHLGIARHYAHKVAIAVTLEHQRLEHTMDILAQRCRHMVGCQIVLVNLIGNQFVGHMGLVQQAGRIGLIYFFHHFFQRIDYKVTSLFIPLQIKKYTDMKKMILSALTALLCIASGQAQFFGVDTDRLSTLITSAQALPQDNAVLILNSTLKAMENDGKAYRKVVEFVERMGDPADSLHNEVLYTEGLKNVVNSFVLSNSEKQRPKALLALAQKNAIGSMATDIEYATPDGKSNQLLTSDKYKLVFFNDIDCDACAKVKEALAQSTALSDAVKGGLLQVVSIYTGSNEKAWKKSQLPAWVINGWDKKQQVEAAEAYVLSTTPLFYLLSRDGKVLLKNEPSLKRVESAIGRVLVSSNNDATALAKMLFNK